MTGGRVCFPQFWRFWGQVSLAALAAGVLAAAQEPVTMTISGRIVSAANGKPVPGATASANCEGCDSLLAGKADPDGRYQIVVHEPSRYRVFTAAPGYVTQTYGDEPELGWTPVNVQRGARIGTIDFSLHRGSTVAGVVTDEFKEPVIGATVRALARQGVDGESQLVARTSTRTDDRGMYRLIGLEAGEYFVSVTDGLATTFAPSAATPTSARRITIGADAEQDNVNIQTKASPTGGVEGIIAGPGVGSPALTINLIPDPNPAALRAAGVRPLAGNRFEMTNIPAGRYALFVRPVSAETPMPRAFPSWAREPVIVAAGATTHVAVTLRTGSRISGRVTAPESPRGQVRLNPLGTDHPEASQALGTVTADGLFVMANVAPGRYRWVPTQQLTRSGTWLLSVFLKDADITDFPFTIAADTPIDDLRVTLREPARIAGTVLDANGHPTTAGAVIVAATDSRYWTPVSRRIQIVRPDTQGTFEFRLPEGRYQVAHVTALKPGQLRDPAFLKTLAAGRVVMATAGRTATVELRLK